MQFTENASVVMRGEPRKRCEAGRWRRLCVVSWKGSKESLLAHLSCSGPGTRRDRLALM